MKSYRLCSFSGSVLTGLLATTTVLALAAPASAATPTGHALPALPGSAGATATAVNNLGTIVGYVSDANFNTLAVKWSPAGAITSLGTLPGDEYSEATGINDLGQIVGFSGSTDGDEHAVEWNAHGAITDLGAAPGQLSDSDAYGINDFGEVAGADNPAPRQVNAVLWRKGVIDNFGAAEENDIGDTAASAVNDLGTIVGQDFVIHSDASHESVRWNADGSYVRLPYLADERGPGGGATAINNLNVVVGNSPTHTFHQPHAVRWDQHGNITDLGTLPSGIDSFAYGINDLGLVVGTASDADAVDHAVTWSRTGTLRRLPELPGGSGSEALAVSDTGLVVGDAYDANGTDVAMVWH